MVRDENIMVTIIVPVYNSEKSIRNCAMNLVNQTLKEIEILFIDDCSADSSYDMLQQIKLQFPNTVKVFRTQKNSGPGGARNVGLEHARGKYIGFVDSDDLADVSMYEKLYSVAQQKKADIVDCGFISEQNQSIIMSVPDHLTGHLDLEKKNILISQEGYIWCKLFNREVIERYHIRFRENVAMEDTDFILYLYAVADSIEVLKETLYKHTWNQDSMMETMTQYNNYRMSYKTMNAIFNRLSELPYYEKIKTGCEAIMIGLYLCGIINCMNTGYEYKKVLSMLENLRTIKKQIITDGYDNPLLLSNLDENCISIMKTNDRNPCELLNG